MKFCGSWIFIIFTRIFQLTQVTTDARSVSAPIYSKANKRQFSGNAIHPGQEFVQDATSPQQTEAALAKPEGNPGDRSTEFQATGGFRNAGCFKDTESRAVGLLEGSDPELTGFYKERQDAIAKCASVARSRGFQLFAIQNGGMCLSGAKAHDTYKIHGLARNCKDGKGGPWANDVYIFNDFPLEVHIFTGTLPKAGTDSNVYLSFTGSMGTSRRIALTPEAADHNSFEAGQQDTFNVHTIPLGSISGITIGHDDTGQATAGWYLEKIVVKDAANNMYKFQVNRWFAKDEDDGKIERELILTSTISPGSYKALGCFKERTDVNKERAVPSLEGRDEMLDGQEPVAYKGREFAVEKCADAARRRGYVMFAIQDGGLCATSKEIQNTYSIYGEGDDCYVNGTGSLFSSTIYAFTDQEPGFKDAEGTATAVGKGTESTTNTPATPSDPAMQVAGQAPPPQVATQSPGTTSTGGTSESSPSTTSTPEATPSTATAGTSPENGEASKKPGSASKEPAKSPETNQATGGKKPTAWVNKQEPESTGSNESGTSRPDQTTDKAESKPDEPSKEKPESGQSKPEASTKTGTENPSVSAGKGGSSGEGKTDSKTPEKTAGQGGAKESGSKEKEKSPETGVKPSENAGGDSGTDEKTTKGQGDNKTSDVNQTGTGTASLTPQEPKIYPSREDTKIPTPNTGSNVGAISPLLETPVTPKVHKIAPETRLPGEFTSPTETGNKAFVKTFPENESVRSLPATDGPTTPLITERPKTSSVAETPKPNLVTETPKTNLVTETPKTNLVTQTTKTNLVTQPLGEAVQPNLVTQSVKKQHAADTTSMPFNKQLLDARRQEGNHEFFRR